MASINKLSIRGVRAFSPDDDEQVVEFFFPLTIITVRRTTNKLGFPRQTQGANGCGKTTIIESLKYALSGSLPPAGGTRSAGQSFVHDPRFVNQPVVKANVKLRFTNKANAGMVVVRSMELTKKKTALTFKALDGVLRTMDKKTGERVSVSQKCSELDKQIPSLLGVSRAVLDYVLFVHQEDSSWPLQEASVLKKRFDDIFDSTRYTKALESFRKTKKELTSQMKDTKAELAGLESHKHAAKGFRKEKETQSQNLKELEEEIDQCMRTRDNAKKEEDKLLKILSQVDEVDGRIEDKAAELKNLKSVASKQRSMLEEDLTEDYELEKLNEMLQDFGREMSQQRDRKEELSRFCRDLQNDIEDLRQKELRLNSAKGKFAAEKEANEKRQRERFALMEKVARTYSIDLLAQSSTQLSRLDASMSISQTSLFTGGGAAATSQNPLPVLTKEDMDSFFECLERKEKELKENLKSHKEKFRKQEDEFNNALQVLVGNRNAFEKEREKLINEKKEIDDEERELSKTLGGNRIKKSSITEIREKAKDFQIELERLTHSDKRDQLGTEIRSHSEKLDSIDEDIGDKMSKRKRLKRGADLKRTIDMLEQQRSKDVGNLKIMLESKTETLRSLNIELPNALTEAVDIATFTSGINSIIESVRSKHQTASQKLKAEGAKEAEAKAEVSHEQSSLRMVCESKASLEKKLSELYPMVEKVNDVVEGMNKGGYQCDWRIENHEPNDLLRLLDNQLLKHDEDSPEDLQPDLLLKLSKRLRKLEKRKNVCPCCNRGMSEDERTVFLEETKQLFSDNSPLAKSDNASVQDWRNEKTKLDTWRATVYGSLNDVLEYRRIRSELKETEQMLPKLEQLVKTKKEVLATFALQTMAANEVEAKVAGLFDACKLWNTEVGRIEEQSTNINDKREHLQLETCDEQGNGSLEDLDEELQRLRDEKDRHHDRIGMCNKEITAFNQEITDATYKVNNARDLLRKKEEKFAEDQEATKRKRKLEERKTNITEDEIKLGELIASLHQKIKTKDAEKSRLYSHASEEETQLNETLTSFLNDAKNLRDATKLTEEYTRNNGGDGLDRIASEMSKVVSATKTKAKELQAVQPELENVAKAVADHERHRQLLLMNIDLMKGEERMVNIEQEAEQLKQDKENIDGHDTAVDMLDKLKEAQSRNESKVACLSGRRSEIIEQIRSLQRKLQSEEYRDVDESHRAEKIKYDTTKVAIDDIEAYSSALVIVFLTLVDPLHGLTADFLQDKALLRFHSMKIAEINKLIHELWSECYKGGDIGSIEIESGQDSRAAKSYNYRVVMTKGTKSVTKLDMRGRCSAGQRVLASIVVRLALAETFGVTLGCIVLDEPTVNLDEDNKRGLAVAMAKIIANRSKQRNFQLVLITHDEGFVSMMKDELSTQTGVSMPEKYFHVRREQSEDENYYSKIDSVDWEELMCLQSLVNQCFRGATEPSPMKNCRHNLTPNSNTSS